MAEMEYGWSPRDLSDTKELRADRAKVYLKCKVHGYANGRPPRHQCLMCWENYFFICLARTPPSKQDERLEQWSQTTHHVAELVEKGIDLPVIQRIRER